VTTIAHTFRSLLTQGLDRLDAQLLLLHALQRPETDRAWLLVHDADALDDATCVRLLSLAQRRARGEPLAYVTGHKEFYSLDLAVDARVLVPRPDTETLVDWALEALSPTPAASVIDLGTGSGAIALALKHTRGDLQVSAVDFSLDALDVAQSNARRLQLDVRFSQGSWLDHVQGRFDLIVSNPPYIAANDPHLPALVHEPLQALASGSDGLDDIRTIICQAAAHLEPGGWLLLEHGYNQAAAVRALLADAGLHNTQSRRDLAGIERCSGAHSPQT
jgi:release factor glutamine methyltransferase